VGLARGDDEIRLRPAEGFFRLFGQQDIQVLARRLERHAKDLPKTKAVARPLLLAPYVPPNRLDIRQYKQQLRPLLNEPTAQDPHLELVGNALRALWPDDMSAEELFGIIQPPPERFGGAHVMFMSHSEESIQSMSRARLECGFGRDGSDRSARGPCVD
jgi:hypothetical protein